MENAVVKNMLNWSKRLFAPLALSFVAYFAWQSRDLLIFLISDSNLLFLFLSFLCWVSTHFIGPVFTVLVMKGFPTSLTYKEAFLIHASRLPAKYLPGGIWHTVARAADYKSKNVSLTGIGYYLLLEHLIAACVTLFIGGTIVIALNVVDDSWATLVVVITLLSGVGLIILPGLISIVRSYRTHAISRASYTQCVMLIIGFWFVAATSFVLFIKAFDAVVIDYSSIGIGGIYVFSWGIGFISLFAPQGIGVTEFVSGTLLRPEIPLSTFIVLLASFRLNVFLADMTTWLIALRIRS